MFQENDDPEVERVFKDVAQASGRAWGDTQGRLSVRRGRRQGAFAANRSDVAAHAGAGEEMTVERDSETAAIPRVRESRSERQTRQLADESKQPPVP
jgi:hypothetical protein